MRLRIASYNLHDCVGTDGRSDPERSLEVLRELDADVVALQELRWDVREARHLLHRFGEALGCETLAGPTLLRNDGHYGNAILTRLAVREVVRTDLSAARREPRGALAARLAVSTAELHVIATHLGLRPGERREQMRRLLTLVDARASAPVVLIGDLNEWFLWGRPLRALRRRFGPTPAPPTFPARRPLFALDRVWVAPRAALRSVRTHASPLARVASDHLPLCAEILLQEASVG